MPAEEGFGSPRAGMTGGFEPYSVSAVNQTLVPCQEEPGREPSILDTPEWADSWAMEGRPGVCSVGWNLSNIVTVCTIPFTVCWEHKDHQRN